MPPGFGKQRHVPLSKHKHGGNQPQLTVARRSKRLQFKAFCRAARMTSFQRRVGVVFQTCALRLHLGIVFELLLDSGGFDNCWITAVRLLTLACSGCFPLLSPEGLWGQKVYDGGCISIQRGRKNESDHQVLIRSYLWTLSAFHQWSPATIQLLIRPLSSPWPLAASTGLTGSAVTPLIGFMWCQLQVNVCNQVQNARQWTPLFLLCCTTATGEPSGFYTGWEARHVPLPVSLKC